MTAAPAGRRSIGSRYSPMSAKSTSLSLAFGLPVLARAVSLPASFKFGRSDPPLSVLVSLIKPIIASVSNRACLDLPKVKRLRSDASSGFTDSAT